MMSLSFPLRLRGAASHNVCHGTGNHTRRGLARSLSDTASPPVKFEVYSVIDEGVRLP
jgi:hypothetical protein